MLEGGGVDQGCHERNAQVVAARPSYRLRPGDFLRVAERSGAKEPFVVAASGAHADPPAYLEEQLVVECYSR